MPHNTAYSRRHTHPVRAGKTIIGGSTPVVIQTMTNTSTLDTEATATQIARCVDAGATLVRMTAQGVTHAANLAEIREKLNSLGVEVDLVADIHFNPAAAFEAARHVEKVRINPGNFVDPGRTFRKIEYDDISYNAELEKLRKAFIPFLEVCRENRTAIRIGVNHGSLSDRIMSRYGDTPEGMVESAMEFLRVAVENNFPDIVVSIKASNVLVMTRTVRLLVQAMEKENMTFPIHLGVTEAGDGEDGRVKSAVGIGSLLAEGIGDTIRVSLSEAPEAEIPVARDILEHISRIATGKNYVSAEVSDNHPKEGETVPYVLGLDTDTPRGTLLHAVYPAEMTPEKVTVAASIDLGRMLLDPELHVDGISITAPSMTSEQTASLALSILQATRRRISKTEYIACPGCGRTLFDLGGTLEHVRQATSHLKGLKIGVMGCIVNGPGEMADADYGYVGAAKNNVSIYRGRICVLKNVPASSALPALIQLIKDDGKWVEPSN